MLGKSLQNGGLRNRPKGQSVNSIADASPVGPGAYAFIRGIPYRWNGDPAYGAFIRAAWYRSTLTVDAGVDGDVVPSSENPPWTVAQVGGGTVTTDGTWVTCDGETGTDADIAKAQLTLLNEEISTYWQGYIQGTVAGEGALLAMNVEIRNRRVRAAITADGGGNWTWLTAGGTGKAHAEVHYLEAFLPLGGPYRVYADHERTPMLDAAENQLVPLVATTYCFFGDPSTSGQGLVKVKNFRVGRI